MSEQRPHRPMQRPAAPCNNILRDREVIERYIRSRNELSERQKNAAELLLQGLSDQEVSNRIGVERSTIFRWRKCVAFARELDRQRHLQWERSVSQLQAMVPSALEILRNHLESDDPKLRMRAVSVLLRFATPSRLLSPNATRQAEVADRRRVDDLIAYVDAPVPGQPGAPETMTDEDLDEAFDEDDMEDEKRG